MPDLDRATLERYLTELLGESVRVVTLAPLGEDRNHGSVKGHGYGVPVLVECEAAGARRRFVVETMSPGPFGHENMSDRAQMLLWDHQAYNTLPRHVRSIDVGAFRRNHAVVSLGDAEEFFLLTEFAEGRGYIEDLARLLEEREAAPADLARADALCDYLVGIHGIRGGDAGLYARRIRELVGHGECVMGLTDSYPRGHEAASAELLESIEHACVRWRWRIRDRAHRLRQVHGDFHPWNVLFRKGSDFTILDRSRGEWGEPADDVTSMTGNYLFFALQQGGRFAGPFQTLFRRFWDRYLDRSGDREILEVCAPFYAFRCLVMASPVWYPALPAGIRHALFRFMRAVLDADSFDPARVDDYLAG